MGLKADLEERVEKYLKTKWTRRDGKVVPDDSSVTLDNDAVDIVGAVLYADLRGSTSMVDSMKDYFAAEVYKSFLYCAARVITSEGGTVTAYDGDRIMAVYIGESKNTSAVRSALRINWACDEIINPLIKKHYTTDYVMKHTIGIDTSKLMITKTGARGSNDLVWVGRAANHAAKMTEWSEYKMYIDQDIYNNMNDEVKYANNVDMWTKRSWGEMKRSVYGSNYRRTIP